MVVCFFCGLGWNHYHAMAASPRPQWRMMDLIGSMPENSNGVSTNQRWAEQSFLSLPYAAFFLYRISQIHREIVRADFYFDVSLFLILVFLMRFCVFFPLGFMGSSFPSSSFPPIFHSLLLNSSFWVFRCLGFVLILFVFCSIAKFGILGIILLLRFLGTHLFWKKSALIDCNLIGFNEETPRYWQHNCFFPLRCKNISDYVFSFKILRRFYILNSNSHSNSKFYKTDRPPPFPSRL